jgi:hypothetical protein
MMPISINTRYSVDLGSVQYLLNCPAKTLILWHTKCLFYVKMFVCLHTGLASKTSVFVAEKF